MVIIISAIGSNRIIGTGEGLPWHIPSEYELFLSHIKGQTVIMGRRSYEIFKKDMLPERMVIVSSTLKKDQATVFASLEEALTYSNSFPEDVFICGGQSIYEEGIRHADYMFLSFIKGEHQGNVYFPEFDADDWVIDKKEDQGEFTFVIYRKKPVS